MLSLWQCTLCTLALVVMTCAASTRRPAGPRRPTPLCHPPRPPTRRPAPARRAPLHRRPTKPYRTPHRGPTLRARTSTPRHASPTPHRPNDLLRRTSPVFAKLPIPLPPSKASPDVGAEQRVVLTREVYVAGHSRPHPELCPALGARLRLLVLVTSAPSHAAARDAVRLTWGHYAQRKDVALAFVLGEPPAELRAALQAEDDLYGDIIVGRSLDSPYNKTLTTLSLLEWTVTYCNRAPRLLKTTDHMFINVPRLLEWMEEPERRHDTRTIWGRVVKGSLPRRSPHSNQYVSTLQYPYNTYPEYTAGRAYLLTRDVVRPLLAAAAGQPYLQLEDVFLTGVVAARLGVKRSHEPAFYNKKVAQPCSVKRGIAIYVLRSPKQFDLWRKLITKTKCADSNEITTPKELSDWTTQDSLEITTTLFDLDVTEQTEYDDAVKY